MHTHMHTDILPIAASVTLRHRYWVWPCARSAANVCACLWGQSDESGAYLLLKSAVHYLYFMLTLFITVTQTHTGATPSFLLMAVLMPKIWGGSPDRSHLYSANRQRFVGLFLALDRRRVVFHLDVASFSHSEMVIKARAAVAENTLHCIHLRGIRNQQILWNIIMLNMEACGNGNLQEHISLPYLDARLVLIVLWGCEVAKVAQLYILACLSFVLPPLFLFLHLYSVTQIMLYPSFLSGEAGITH